MDKESLRDFISGFEQCEKYRVEKTLRKGVCETTEIVFEIAADGSQSGPFIRKRFDDPDLWNLYKRIQDAQINGLRVPSLPRIHDTGSDSGGYYSIIEYVRGDNLRSDKGVSALSSFRSVCNAIEILHERFDPPIIHRDIKPDNVIVVPDGVVLIDFGAARSYDSEKDRDTRLYATRAYAAPEQFGFSQTDRRSDIYSLGMLLAFLETGKDPGPDIRDAINSGYRKLIEIGLPEASAKTIEKACAFDPGRRFASVREMLLFLDSQLPPSGAPSIGLAGDVGREASPNTLRDKGDASSEAQEPSYNSTAAEGKPSGAPILEGTLSFPNPLSREQESPAFDGATDTNIKAFSRLPKWLMFLKGRWDNGAFFNAGIVWDMVVLLIWLLFMAVSVTISVDPGIGGVKGNIPQRFIAYIGIAMPIITVAGTLIMDWRPIHAIPVFSSLKRRHIIIVSAAVFIVAMIYCLASGVFAD